MMQIIHSNERYHANYGWLDTKHSFSFNRYYDPNNLHFGCLCVFNDDIIEPGEGFGTHPHDNMEIMTYVISGTLEHQDSMGNKGIINPGEVQTMTAGTGITHSEYNASREEPVHLLQLWFFPNKQDLTPNWEQKKFKLEEQLNRFLPVVSGTGKEGTLPINQDVTVYFSQLENGQTIRYEQVENRGMYLFVIDGVVRLNNEHELSKGDTARITDLTKLEIVGLQNAHFMLIDLIL